jgi:hypothetical protein
MRFSMDKREAVPRSFDDFWESFFSYLSDIFMMAPSCEIIIQQHFIVIWQNISRLGFVKLNLRKERFGRFERMQGNVCCRTKKTIVTRSYYENSQR